MISESVALTLMLGSLAIELLSLRSLARGTSRTVDLLHAESGTNAFLGDLLLGGVNKVELAGVDSMWGRLELPKGRLGLLSGRLGLLSGLLGLPTSCLKSWLLVSTG